MRAEGTACNVACKVQSPFMIALDDICVREVPYTLNPELTRDQVRSAGGWFRKVRTSGDLGPEQPSIGPFPLNPCSVSAVQRSESKCDH